MRQQNINDFNFKVDKRNNYTVYVEQHDSFSAVKNEVNSYLQNPELFNKGYNQHQVERIKDNEDMEFYGGTPDERHNLTSYINPERLQRVRDEVSSDLANLHLPDVRKGIDFHKNQHIFVAERYHAGHKKAFATRRNKPAPQPTVNICLSMGYNCNITADEATYNCLGGIIFADMLAKKGFAVNIYVIGLAKYYESNNAGLNIFKAKDSSGYLDADTLALLASDPRFFRHWVLQFNAISEDKRGREMQSAFGQQATMSQMRRTLEASGLDFDFLFGQCYSHRETVKQVSEAVAKVQEQVNSAA